MINQFMNRFMDFRAWDFKIMRYHYWNIVKRLHENVFWDMVWNENMALEMYTGRKDINSSKVYAGDYVIKMFDHYGEEQFIIAEVRFSNYMGFYGDVRRVNKLLTGGIEQAVVSYCDEDDGNLNYIKQMKLSNPEKRLEIIGNKFETSAEEINKIFNKRCEV